MAAKRSSFFGKIIGRRNNIIPPDGNRPPPPLPGHPVIPAPSPRAKPKPKRTITSEELRDFRELMRQRYSLDIQIWSDREAATWDREIVQDKMDKADATMRTILSKIEAWDNPDYFEKTEDFEKMQTIKERITRKQPWIWAENPPWKGNSEPSF